MRDRYATILSSSVQVDWGSLPRGELGPDRFRRRRFGQGSGEWVEALPVSNASRVQGTGRKQTDRQSGFQDSP